MNDQSKQLVSDLRRWAHAPEALPASDMMDKAATEIERLLVAIAAYAASSKAAAKEIARLRLTDEERVITLAAYDGDIVSRLRNWRGLHLSHSGELFEDAATEIAHLRLTAAEREAVEAAIRDYENNDDDEDCARMVDTLRGLLERIK